MLKKIIILIAVYTLSAGLHAYDDISGVQYIRNYDGDTITFTVPYWPKIIGDKIPIRINGIDTPEMRDKDPEVKRLAKQAKRYLQRQLETCDDIILKSPKRGKYFRIIADVYCDENNVADLLLEKGYARPYNGEKKMQWIVTPGTDIWHSN